MAFARISYMGDGVTTLFSVPFPYIYRNYVMVHLSGVLKAADTDYTWLTSSTILFHTAPASGEYILIYRSTPKDARLVDFNNAAILNEEDMDLDSNQLFHIMQEALDAVYNVREIEVFEAGVDFIGGETTSLPLVNQDIIESSITAVFDGVTQLVTQYTLSSGFVTFTAPIPVGVSQVQISYASPLTGGLQEGSVSGVNIVDSSISTSKLADGAVTSEKILDNSVTLEKLDDDIFTGLVEVVPTDTDYIPISDTSDSGKTKKSTLSTIVAAIGIATTSVRGTLQLATSGEAQAGSSTTKALTPSSLGSTVLGMGQSYVNVTSSRASGITYTNTTGRTIVVSAWALTGGVTNQWAYGYVNGVMIARNSLYANGSDYTAHVYFIVPPGATYSVTLNNVVVGSLVWYELR